ncbi:MAG: winged helix-turn-helix domain-containing protein, partial [Terriglobales bacterium]
MSSAQAPPTRVSFGVFEADLRAGELRRNGVRVRLQDLPFRALTLLLSRPGQVITRNEFRQALWPPDIYVDFEQGISSAVMRLRDALRDSADNPIFIETIERRGYRWIGPIQPADPLSVESQDKESQGKESQEKESPEKQATPVAAPVSSRLSPWWMIVFAVPVLALLFAVWIFLPGFRGTKASAKSSSASARILRQPANREAEDFYLKGRYYWNKRTPDSLHQALESFTQAIAHDPNYSDAYVGLADCYNLLREFSAMPGNEAYFKA